MQHNNKATTILFCNLKVLGSVRQHERLRTRGGEMLDISRHGVFEGLRRWLTGESRDHNLHAVQTVLDSAFSYIMMLVERADQAATDGTAPDSADATFMRRLDRQLRGARRGCAACRRRTRVILWLARGSIAWSNRSTSTWRFCRVASG